jgi:hypothetical protein
MATDRDVKMIRACSKADIPVQRVAAATFRYIIGTCRVQSGIRSWLMRNADVAAVGDTGRVIPAHYDAMSLLLERHLLG